MFDRSKEFVVKILSGGEKQCVVRFPTDEEWCERTRGQRAIRRQLGRGRAEYDTSNTEAADAALFLKIRVDEDGPEFDEAEGSYVVGRLERCQVLDVERIGDRFRIAMQVAGGEVAHVLKIPAKRAAIEYGRASVRAIESRRSQEIRLALEPSAELWAKVYVDAEGYHPASGEEIAAAVPIVHKDVAVVELLAAVEAAQDEDDPDPEN